MWIANVFLLLLYSFCSPYYQAFVDSGATIYVWVPTIENPEPTGPPPEFVAIRACPVRGALIRRER